MERLALQAARELIPQVQAFREETETRRCLTPLAEALRRSRLARMSVVQPLDGLETPPVEVLEVYETLAGTEASVSWVVWNNALPCLLSRFLPPPARAEIFADPHGLYASSTRPSGKATVADGGYRMSGRWSLVSGCELADWITLLCRVHEPDGRPREHAGEPELRFLYVRCADYRIIDTWHVSGLRGTGSHDVELEDLFVPEARTAVPGPSTLDAAFGRIPIISTMAAGFAAQVLGIASAGFGTVLELARTKVSPDPRPGLRDQPANQASIALHRSALAAARTHLHGSIDAVWNKAVNAEPISLEDTAAVWGAAMHAVRVGGEALEDMFGIAGTTSLYTDCPLERAHRDLHAMMRHIVVQPLWLEDAGRVAFGLAPQQPLFAL